MHIDAIRAVSSSIYHTSEAADGERFLRNETFSGLGEETIVTDS